MSFVLVRSFLSGEPSVILIPNNSLPQEAFVVESSNWNGVGDCAKHLVLFII